MGNNSNSQQSWWKRDAEHAFNQRMSEIQKINDPGTSADEMLAWSKRIIMLLLIFTGALGFIAYQKHFASTLDPALAIILAAAIVITMEFGKAYVTREALRTIFFRFRTVFMSPAHTFFFLALVAVAIATFSMSVHNSTIGAQRLSTMLGQEKTQAEVGAFAPDTKQLDAQIAAANDRVKANQNIKWKGTVTTTAQRAINRETKNLENLYAARETAITTQRADYERQRGIADTNTSTASTALLAIGGWVELLQIILMVLRVSCEKVLDSRQVQGATQHSGSPKAQQPSIGFQRQAAAAENGTPTPSAETHIEDQPPKVWIGFNRGDDGNIRSSATIPSEPAILHSETVSNVIPSRAVEPAGNLINIPLASIPHLPGGVEQQEDGFIRFKQTGDLFKHVREEGIVIGLLYKGPRMQNPQVMSYAQVKSRISSYKNNKWRNQATRAEMIAMWEFALGLFERPEKEEEVNHDA